MIYIVKYDIYHPHAIFIHVCTLPTTTHLTTWALCRYYISLNLLIQLYKNCLNILTIDTKLIGF